MISLKQIITAVALIGAIGAANATEYNLIPGNTAGYSVSGSFEDKLNFSLSAPASFGYSVVNLPSETFTSLSVPGFGVITLSFVSNIIGLSANLFTSSNVAVAAGSALNAGSYYIGVTGTGVGTGGTGTYGVASAIAAVPEPESYAMFLAGLGIMGAVARRRSKKA